MQVIIELRPPSSTAADGPQFLHDSLLVLAGSVCVLRVPVRAVPGAEPVPAAAFTSFWPPQKEIDAHCDSFTSQVKAMYDTLSASRPAAVGAVPAALRPPPAASVSTLTQPGTPLTAPMPVGSEVADSSGAAAGAVRSSSMGASGTSASAASPTLLRSGSGSTAAVVPPAVMATAVIPAAAASQPMPELPPEGFSQPQDLYDDAGDVLYDEDGDVLQQPFVLHKTVKVQGRVAVAVPADGGDGGAAASAVGSTSNGRSSGGPGLLSLPPGNSLSRTNSTSSFTGAAAVGLGGNGSRPGSASGGKLAFALNGKLYDARGNLLDPSLEQVSAVGGLMVVDCGEGAPSPSPSPPQQQPQPQPQQQQAIRTSSSGTSLTSLTPPRLSTPPGSGNGSGSVGAGAGAGGAATGLSPGPGSSRVSLAPLKYGNLPVTASLRPGSAASSMSPHLGRPPPPPPAYTGSAGPGVGATATAAPSAAGAGGSDDDPLRKAALAAALRELGISDLPAPSPRRPPSSGQMPTGPGTEIRRSHLVTRKPDRDRRRVTSSV
ncbi:hypothetical protein Vafri_21336 [Volvox africanus]|uniref:Uncharacterized protein n=1 Tax=Volvox africanus TaxID=51714 RepID=A0A8J4BT92_9CHLO|nr:hypothetical protein Vafri_21336 [Volvox africanus]